MSRRGIGSLLAVLMTATVLSVGPGAGRATASQPSWNVPAQFISKAYTEAYGTAPPLSVWANFQNFYLANPCTSLTLDDWGKDVLKSAALRNHYPLPDTTQNKHTYAARILLLYRASLNREPSNAELASGKATLANAVQTTTAVQAAWDALVNAIFDSSSFTWLADNVICPNAGTDKDPAAYGWNPAQIEPPTDMPWSGECGVNEGVGGELNSADLQPLLDAAAAQPPGPGRVVKLAQGAQVWAEKQIVIPQGVTLTTCGTEAGLLDPLPTRYGLQARIIRKWVRVANAPDVTWPYTIDASTSVYEFATVRLEMGGTLDKVWVDGNRNLAENQCTYSVSAFNGTCHNVQMSRLKLLPTPPWPQNTYGQILCPGQDNDDIPPPGCPVNTTVSNARLDNGAGGTTLSNYGGMCRSTEYITGNLITAYQSRHSVTGTAQYMDGMTVTCEMAEVTQNTVIDATDVPILLWRPAANHPTESEQWQYYPDNRVMRAKIEHNTVIAAGNSNWGGIWHSTGFGEQQGGGLVPFNGSTIKFNHIYTSVAATMHALIVLGSRVSTKVAGAQRTVANAVTYGPAPTGHTGCATQDHVSCYVDSPTANFTQADVNKLVVAWGLPPSTTIASVVSSTRVKLSRAAYNATTQPWFQIGKYSHPDWMVRGEAPVVTDNDTSGQVAFVNLSVMITSMRYVNLTNNDFGSTRVAFGGVGGLPTGFTGWYCGAGHPTYTSALAQQTSAPVLAELSSVQGSGYWALGTLAPNTGGPAIDAPGVYTDAGGLKQGCMRLDT